MPIHFLSLDLQPAAVPESSLEGLERRLRGEVVVPGHPLYEDLRKVWNGLIDKRPAAIVRCAHAEDVVHAVRFAAERRLRLAVRGGGHNVAGRAVEDGALVVDLSLMRGVSVDPDARVADVQGGALLGDVDRQTQPYGLAAPLGLVTATGVAGFTLHGGYGWLSRRCGLAVDALEAAEVVTADGRRRLADARTEPDLFWAVRGGGGNFGVVTSLRLKLFPIGPRVWFSATFYPLAQARQVLARVRDAMRSAPEELGALATFWSTGEGPLFPEGTRNVPVLAIAGCYTGPAEQGEKVLEPLRRAGKPLVELTRYMPFLDVQQFFDADYPNGRCYYWKSVYLPELGADVIDALSRGAASRPSPLTSLDVWFLDGAPTRVDPASTAFAQRGRPYLVALESNWTDKAATKLNVDWTRGVFRELESHSHGEAYLNFPGFAEEGAKLVERAYGANHERLRRLKALYDSGNLFRGNFNLEPLARGAEAEAPAP